MDEGASSISPRHYSKAAAGCPITITIIPLSQLLAAHIDTTTTVETDQWSNASGKARYRIFVKSVSCW